MRKTISSVTILLIGISVAWSCQMSAVGNNVSNKKEKKMISNDNGLRDTATFGAGCFWCVEAAFMQLSGVDSVKSGYSGGFIKNPSYKEVCNGNTGHAEVVQIIYNPSVIDFTQLMEVFFTVHDPTQLNRQGNDIGTQYRSVVFYHNDQQRAIAEKAILAAESSGDWEGKIVTEIKSFEAFYPAEDYHDNYYNQNKEQAYCSLVIKPKMDKFQKKFHDLLKTP
jgi:peptide-methionine (S)-S-oxide reductase